MRREIKSAVNFLAQMLRSHCGQNLPLEEQELEQLSLQLRQVLSRHYKNHWHPECPQKGSAYRCLRINHKLDPLIIKAGQELGIAYAKLVGLFPKEFTLWIDPGEVSYRIGEDGTICVLYESKKNRSNTNVRVQPVKYSPRCSPTSELLETISEIHQSSPINNYHRKPHAQPKSCRQEEAHIIKSFGQYDSHASPFHYQEFQLSSSPPFSEQRFHSLMNNMHHLSPPFVVS